ncbi:hypothetical protein [Nonomuraea sp. NPDC049141]|uniref:hypothetical protein n=1 Tax=unclassified Nonomuraea TaxID=2593643 RepID=UPI0033D3962F
MGTDLAEGVLEGVLAVEGAVLPRRLDLGLPLGLVMLAGSVRVGGGLGDQLAGCSF